jgi:ABC-type transport system involved in cytochrome c biogenesis permease component
MSAAANVPPPHPSSLPANRAGVRLAQLLVIVRREVAAQLLRWRGAWIYLLAFGPFFIILMHAMRGRGNHRVDNEMVILAGIFQFFYLHVGILIGCAAIFTRSFRGDVLDRSLHYYLLAPLRRELLVLGKLLGGLIAVGLAFETGVLACFLLMFGHAPEGKEFLHGGPALAHLTAYLGTTALACLGYGAIFLALGIAFKNPTLPALIVFGVESWSGVLPSALQRLTVTYYLKPLCPVAVPPSGWTGVFTVVVEPTPTWLAVAGLLALTAVVLAAASVWVRHLEVNYTTD